MHIMHRLLRGETSPETAAERLGAPVERLAIYQQFARNHIDNVLKKNYTVLAGLFSEQWDELVDGYLAEYPPGSYELNRNAARFREYLATLALDPARGITEFHLELAELEWTEFSVYASQVEIPTPEEVTRPMLNPTLQILALKNPVAEYVDRWRASGGDKSHRPDILSPASPETVFVLRHPVSGLALYLKADHSLLFAFKVAHEGANVAEAAKLAGISETDAVGILHRAADAGLIVLPG